MVEFRAGKMNIEGTRVTPDTRKGLVRIGKVCLALEVNFVFKYYLREIVAVFLLFQLVVETMVTFIALL